MSFADNNRAQGPTAEQTVEIAERLRHCIASITTTDTPSVTGSMGVAYCTPPRQANLADLLQVADTALYQAKVGGRNRVDITLTHRLIDGGDTRSVTSSACWTRRITTGRTSPPVRSTCGKPCRQCCVRMLRRSPKCRRPSLV